MLKKYQEKTMGIFSDEYSMLTCDGRDFPKKTKMKGKMSAYVARKYPGALEKTDNRQPGVFLGVVGEKGYAL
jgi:SRSO17 transposase